MQLLKSSAGVYLEEADELLSKGDIIQASEKYYKDAEEAIKILSYKNWVWRYLIEDFLFVFFTMSIITVLVLLVLITEFLVNISFKGMSYIERQIYTSKTRESENGNNKI